MLPIKQLGHAFHHPWLIQCRSMQRMHWLRKHLKDLWHRQVIAGEADPVPRSSLPNWNYDSELFAFGKRLGEDFQLSTLRRAFIHQSHWEAIVEEQDAITGKYAAVAGGGSSSIISAQSVPSDSTVAANDGEDYHNEDLVDQGRHVIQQYVSAYMRYHLPKFPEEGIEAVVQHLTNPEKLCYLGKHVGVYDLIKPEDVPIPEQVVARTFEAIVGALANDKSMEAAEQFVQDIVLTQLVGYDINEAWMPVDPMGILVGMLAQRGMGEPEPRLLRQSGVNTIVPIYLVGIYSDRNLIGEGPGETVLIAEEMAARYALQTLWATRECDICYSFGDQGLAIDLAHAKSTPNPRLSQMVSEPDALDFSSVSGGETVEEPIDPADALIKYKNDVEGPLGQPLRRRLMHKFHRGSKHRRNRRITNQPKPHLV